VAVEHSERSDLILAVSEKLNLEKAGVELPTSGAKVIRYKEKLSAKVVLAELESELI
jgi:hypothetical protein